MNLSQLRYFEAVATHQTVSAAAASLHISQPSLSSAIRDLEQEFGVRLFHRQHRGMTLTPEGKTLLTLSRDLLSRADEATSIMRDYGKARKTLRLGVPPMIGSLLLPQIYRDFLPAHPEIHLEITEAGRETLTGKLTENYLDMVILPHSSPMDAVFSSRKLTQFEIVCGVSHQHALADKATVRPEDFSDLPIVLFENSFFQTAEIKAWFRAADVKPHILLQTGQLSSVISMLSHNIAAGFMFRELIREYPLLAPLSLGTPFFIDVSLVWKKDTYFYSGMRKFREYAETKKLFL